MSTDIDLVSARLSVVGDSTARDDAVPFAFSRESCLARLSSPPRYFASHDRIQTCGQSNENSYVSYPWTFNMNRLMITFVGYASRFRLAFFFTLGHEANGLPSAPHILLARWSVPGWMMPRCRSHHSRARGWVAVHHVPHRPDVQTSQLRAHFGAPM